ncbi:putative poly-gamma-glutamate biosynthesis protein [Calothrix sp. NIES-4071]|nr:putative poly-gamma-glutamate biosynthesis protein [Calothrix sp. NIES-4071]BAZ59039.1 putative poly-gamma-glutamate biosynthesis protein [Calothrix sp. NIES-4105]
MNYFNLNYFISFIGLTFFSLQTPSFYLANNFNINNSTQPSQKSKSEYITIKAVGDIVAGTNFPDYRLPRNPNQLFPKPVRDKLKNSDILFGNYESTLTNHPYTTKNTSRGMVFAFRSPPEYAKLFSQVGFDVMSVANNHAMDFGKIGFSDTVNNLNAAGVKTVGAKNQILYTEVKNIPVAWIGFCFYEYCNTVQDIQKAKALVKQARQKAKIVIISMHVGREGSDALHVRNQTEYFYGENRGNSVLFARSMVDAGADLILGHGPHVPRAMEVYKGKLIAYSLGNFLGYKTFSTTAEKGDSLILEAKLNQDGDFVSGKIDSIQLDKTGIPQVDKYGETIDLVRSLTQRNFPNSKISINRKGEINFPEADVASKDTSK